MSELVDSWSQLELNEAPHILPDDQPMLSSSNLLVEPMTWPQYIHSNDFELPGDTRFHSGLLPMPYIGTLSSATIFILMLNPGLGPIDYFSEYGVEEYRSALRHNLHQTESCSFMFLDPQLSWTGGYRYWRSKLGGVIETLAETRSSSIADAQSYLRSRLAVVQRVPYHSVKYKLPIRVARSLPSIQLAHNYVHESVIPRARNGEALVISTRAVRMWELPVCDNVLAYSGSEAVGAHLTPSSRGGAAILRFLS